jgi:hypothetical protein
MAMIKRVLVADGDILVTSPAQRGFGAFKEVHPFFTADVTEGLRQLSDAVLPREEPGCPRLYGAVIECLWPDAVEPSLGELDVMGITSDDVQAYRSIHERGQELYRSTPPLGLLLAMRAARLKAPVVLTVYPTSRLSAEEQMMPVLEYASTRGWKCYAPGKADKTSVDFWKKCITRFDNKWMERGVVEVGESATSS